MPTARRLSSPAFEEEVIVWLRNEVFLNHLATHLGHILQESFISGKVDILIPIKRGSSTSQHDLNQVKKKNNNNISRNSTWDQKVCSKSYLVKTYYFYF